MSGHTTYTHSVCPSSVCVLHPPPFGSTRNVFSEPRAAEGPWRGPDPQWRRPDLHVRRHCHHSQWGVRQRWRCRLRVQLERKWQKERQHLRGSARAWAGLPRAGAAEPWHTLGLPHRGSRLTLPVFYLLCHISLTWPSQTTSPPSSLCILGAERSAFQISQKRDKWVDLRGGVQSNSVISPSPGAELKENLQETCVRRWSLPSAVIEFTDCFLCINWNLYAYRRSLDDSFCTFENVMLCMFSGEEEEQWKLVWEPSLASSDLLSNHTPSWHWNVTALTKLYSNHLELWKEKSSLINVHHSPKSRR